MFKWKLLNPELGRLLSSLTFVVVVQSLSRVWLSDLVDCSKPGFPVLHYLLEFAQTHVHWVDNAIKSSHPLLLLLLPSVFPSMRVFSNELALCIRWPKFWNFSISPSNEFQGWFPLGLTGLIFLLSKGLSRVKYFLTFLLGLGIFCCTENLSFQLFKIINHSLKINQ